MASGKETVLIFNREKERGGGTVCLCIRMFNFINYGPESIQMGKKREILLQVVFMV